MIVNDAVLIEIKIAPQYDKRRGSAFCSNLAGTRSNIDASASESVFHLCPSVAKEDSGIDQCGCMISRTKTLSCPSSSLRTSVISYGRSSSLLTVAPCGGGA